MARVNNDAVDLEITVDLNWYQLGFQFADQDSQNQMNFLAAFTQGVDEWSNSARLTQFEMITEKFNEYSEEDKLKLANFLQELADRLRA